MARPTLVTIKSSGSVAVTPHYPVAVPLPAQLQASFPRPKEGQRYLMDPSTKKVGLWTDLGSHVRLG